MQDHIDFDNYQVWWHSGITIDRLIPGQTYQQACDRLNDVLEQQGNIISQWQDRGDCNTAARLIRANWIFHCLDHHPIRKPLLVEPRLSHYSVLCGDTRMMAVQQRKHHGPVSCVAIQHQDTIDRDWTNWVKIHDDDHLLLVCGMNATSGRVVFGFHPNGLPWLEIGDHTTHWHLHDQQEREDIMQDFLNSQGSDFRFDATWITKRLPGLDKYYALC
jgi:hypothetical protein